MTLTYGETHVPRKYVRDEDGPYGPLHVDCSCGKFTAWGVGAMDAFRKHYASGTTQETAPAPINTNQRTKRSRLK